MKKTILLAVILLICPFYGFAASPAAGAWDCIVTVDMEYPFVLIITEEEGGLKGTAEAPNGEAGPVEQLKLENGVLSFSIDNPEMGVFEFEATLDGDTLKGSFKNWDVSGEFTAALQK